MLNMIGAGAGLMSSATGSALESATRAADRANQIAQTQEMRKDIQLANELQRQVTQEQAMQALKTAAYDTIKKTTDEIKQKA